MDYYAIITFIIGLPNLFLPIKNRFTQKELKIIVWGGLRGGLSIAMVLSLPLGEQRNTILIATYACVVFSIMVQGLTIEKVAIKK